MFLHKDVMPKIVHLSLAIHQFSPNFLLLHHIPCYQLYKYGIRKIKPFVFCFHFYLCASSYSNFRNPDKILILQPEELQIVSDFPTSFGYEHFGFAPRNNMMETLKIKKNP